MCGEIRNKVVNAEATHSERARQETRQRASGLPTTPLDPGLTTTTTNTTVTTTTTSTTHLSL